MKVAHIAIWHYPKYRTCGPVVYVHNLVRAQLAAGDEAYVVCGAEEWPDHPPYAVRTDLHDEVQYVKITNRTAAEHDYWRPEHEVHDPLLAEALKRIFAARRPDVVHIHNFAGLSFELVAVAHAAGAKVVTSVHNYFPLCSRDDLFFAGAVDCAGPRAQSCSRCLGTMLGDGRYRDRHTAGVAALNASDAVLPVSTRVAEICAAHGVSSELMEVERIGSAAAERLWRELGRERVAAATPAPVPNAANAAAPDTASPQSGAAAFAGTEAEPLRVITFGAALPRKGAMLLLQAARQLARPERFAFTVYGAPSPAELAGFSASCAPELRPAIRFVNRFDQDDLPAILGNADIAVLTPRWQDNGPQTVFEALAAGVPVIGSRMGGIPDVVHDGVNGVLIDEGDVPAIARALTELEADRDRLRKLQSGIEPPRRIGTHAQAVRDIYARIAPNADRATSLNDADHDRVRTDWSAIWPADAEPLSDALVLAASFPELAPRLTVNVTGDVNAAAGCVLQVLSSVGIGEDQLPDVVFNQTAAESSPSISGFREALLATREHGPRLPNLDAGALAAVAARPA